MNKTDWFRVGLSTCVLSLSSACCPCYGDKVKSVEEAAAATAAPKALGSLVATECELRLYMEHESDAQLGFSAIELSGAVATEGVCLKYPDKELELPSRIVIAGKGLTDFGDICDGAPVALNDGREWCVWNHSVRNKYPFSFTFVAKAGQISDYVALARVYRNGSLIARYNSASALAEPQVLRFRASDLRVPNNPFVAHPPHLAELDLRVFPAGATLDEATLDEEVVNYRERAKQRVLSALSAAVPPSLAAKAGEINCVMERVKRLEAQARAVVEPTGVPALSAGCTEDVHAAPADLLSLRELYEKSKGKAEPELEKLDSRARGRIDEIRAALPKLKTELAQKLSALDVDGTKDAVEQTLQRLDQAIAEAATTCDQTLALAQSLRSSVREVLQDRKAQARAYEALVASLDKSGTVLEQYKQNPPIAPGERQLSMKHGDRFQWFALAPWNGVPVSLAEGGSAGELQLANAIPILDLFGGRYQWAASRFADVRFGVGGMYFRDLVPGEDGAEVERFHGAFQANVGIANFKFGIAWVPETTQEGARNWSERELRVLIGSDLLKLISGNNVEAL